MLTILTWAGIIVGSLVGLFILYLIVMLIWMAFAGGAPEGIDVDIACPVLVASHEPVTMTIVVANRLDRPRTLSALDLNTSLLQGLLIERLEPPCRESSVSLGTASHKYDLTIPPRGSTTITLRCLASTPGEHAGDVTLYIDSAHTRFISKHLRIVVRPSA